MHDELITELYAAMVQPGKLATLLDRLGMRFGAESAFMFSSHSEVQPDAVLVGHRMSSNDIKAFASHWHEEDPWALAAARRYMMRRNVVVVGEELLPLGDLQRTRFYNEFARSAGMGRMLGSVLFDGSERNAALPFTNLCWYRPSGKESFSLADKRLLVALLPHLQSGFALRHKLQQLSLHAVPGDHLGLNLAIATFQLDRTGRILERNALGDDLLRRKPPVLQTMGEHVRGIGLRSAPSFAEALQAAERLERPVKLLVQMPDGILVRATLATLPPDRPTLGGLFFSPTLLLMVEMRPAIRDEIVRRAATLFGLTHAERDIVGGLLDGKAPQEIAADRAIAMSTVRTQLRSVLAKSGFARQIDLVRALSRLAD